MESPPLLPWDAHNQRLAERVHPSDWVNPKPSGRYNLVVIGAGTAGLVTAAGAAGLGAKVALVERHLMGGDCLNTGCVPSKALLRSARAVAAIRAAHEFGVSVPPGTTVDFSEVMERMRRLRADISGHDSVQRFSDLGVDVFLGTVRFSDRETVDIAGTPLRFAKAVIATGARAAVPPIPGLNTVPFLTNETLFSLTQLPRRLGIIGAGPVGCEMAQCFARLGSQVSLFTSESGILPKEDREAAEVLEAALRRDGVEIHSSARHLSISSCTGGIQMVAAIPTGMKPVEVDHLLLATGRAPNVEGLGLEIVNVATGPNGIRVDDRLRTSHPRIYACGDVCSPQQFTHAADFMARTVLRNALFGGHARFSALLIPRATYTSPEVASVGLSEADAQRQGIRVDTYTQPLAGVDRNILDGNTSGFARVHIRKGTDKIVGGTIVAPHAGELIGELTVAMKAGMGLAGLGATIHPYPTEGDALRKLGDQFSRTRLTPWVRRLMSLWLEWSRG